MRTSEATCSSAQICRDRGWTPGILLQSTAVITQAAGPLARGPRITRRVVIEITAIGRRNVLAMLFAIHGHQVDGIVDEVIWDLHARDWEPVGEHDRAAIGS